MKLFKIVEGIEEGCRYSLMVSIVALGFSVGISLAKAPTPFAEAADRVAKTAATIICFSSVGALSSGCILSKMLDQLAEESRDLVFRKLAKELEGSEYCIASCKGCKHLIGRVGEKKYFICAMHPYGNNLCEDWESRGQ